MTRRARTLVFLFFAAFLAARFECGLRLPAFEAMPWEERLLRIADLILMEPGYAQARTLAGEWTAYTSKFATDEKRTAELEALANEPAILGFLRDPTGSLAPAFERETTELLNGFGNGAIKAWRLRSIDDKTLLAHDAKRLAGIDTTTARREIGPRYFTIPISGAGFNVSLDAEWDVSRLSDFPLSQINSEYLFLTTDNEMNILAIGNPRAMPDSGFRFISGTKFITEAHGIKYGLRIFATSAKDFKLVICYPFAGYTFYAVRGSLALLLLITVIVSLIKLGSLRSAASHVMENRSGEWLQKHYEQSLGINEQALNLGEKALGVVTSLKEREAKVIGELGRHIDELSANFTAQTKLVLEEAAKAQAESQIPAVMPVSSVRPEVRRPLHKKAVHKAPILINSDAAPEIQVSIELDLPLDDEKQLKPEEKVAYIGSLRRRAAEKITEKEFIRDEKIDNYDYIPPEPMELPKMTHIEASAPDTANLEYVQKFHYSGKARVLPMAEAPAKASTLRMREDLHRETLVVSEEE